MKKIMWLCYLVSTWFTGCGFYKMLVYKNSTSAYAEPKDIVNAYVGGDAYNYIINSERAVAYFVLALLFAVVASSIHIGNKIEEKKFTN